MKAKRCLQGGARSAPPHWRRASRTHCCPVAQQRDAAALLNTPAPSRQRQASHCPRTWPLAHQRLDHAQCAPTAPSRCLQPAAARLAALRRRAVPTRTLQARCCPARRLAVRSRSRGLPALLACPFPTRLPPHFCPCGGFEADGPDRALSGTVRCGSLPGRLPAAPLACQGHPALAWSRRGTQARSQCTSDTTALPPSH